MKNQKRTGHLTILTLFFALLLSIELLSAQGTPSHFKFVFATDLHLRQKPSDASFEALQLVTDLAKANGAAFILSGGDQVDVDGMKPEQLEEAKSLYNRYKEQTQKSGLPWYYTIGNHDRFWDGTSSNVNGEVLFNTYLSPSYYTFDHEGWKFIVLNSVETVDKNYALSHTQLEWLKELLAKTPLDQPIIVSTHVPFLSVYYPVLEGRYTATDTFANQKVVFDLFSKHQLKLVLQGHNHLYEEIHVKGVPFITAGAVSASWWGGAFHGTEEGFLEVTIEDQALSWSYIDYGWEVKK